MLLVTAYFTLCLWLLCAVLMYYSERHNLDPSVTTVAEAPNTEALSP